MYRARSPGGVVRIVTGGVIFISITKGLTTLDDDMPYTQITIQARDLDYSLGRGYTHVMEGSPTLPAFGPFSAPC